MSNFNNILNEQITKSINNFVLLKESFSNYASKVIDYIKSFGKKGKLPSNNEPLEKYYNPSLDTAYKWACESTDGVERDGYAWFKHCFSVDVCGRFKINKRGLIYVERSIDFDTGEGFDNMNYASVGECWTWSPYHSSSYCQNFSLLNNNRISVVLCGYVHPSSIDWVETIYLNTYRCKDEKEIRMNNNAVVEIAYIRIGLEKYRFGGSYLINASANESNKERW